MVECFFWYWPTRVVPDQGPLNGCVVVVWQLSSVLCEMLCSELQRNNDMLASEYGLFAASNPLGASFDQSGAGAAGAPVGWSANPQRVPAPPSQVSTLRRSQQPSFNSPRFVAQSSSVFGIWFNFLQGTFHTIFL